MTTHSRPAYEITVLSPFVEIRKGVHPEVVVGRYPVATIAISGFNQEISLTDQIEVDLDDLVPRRSGFEVRELDEDEIAVVQEKSDSSKDNIAKARSLKSGRIAQFTSIELASPRGYYL